MASVYWRPIGAQAQATRRTPSAKGVLAATALAANKDITWGVNFSQSQAEYLGLDWKSTYLAIVNDLAVRHIKLLTDWGRVEEKRNNFDFSDTDWQLKQAEQKRVQIIFVLGLKTGRWPECHIPEWVELLPKEAQQQELLSYITLAILRYKSNKAIGYWQIENEPFFRFGSCPAWYYRSDELLRREVALVRQLDPSRKIIISDSGESSNWQHAAEIGDLVGTTMYRTNVGSLFGPWTYTFLPPAFYSQKVETIKARFGKEVICVELQAEPWAAKPLMQAPLSEQQRLMNAVKLQESIEFAKSTGLRAFYLWGAEWWFWMKERQGQPTIWNEAKRVFAQ